MRRHIRHNLPLYYRKKDDERDSRTVGNPKRAGEGESLVRVVMGTNITLESPAESCVSSKPGRESYVTGNAYVSML